MGRERQPSAAEERADRMAAAVDRQAQALERIARRMEPEPTPRYRNAGDRSPFMFDGETHAALLPLLVIAYKREVPKRAVQSKDPGLARVDCPCGAVVEIPQAEQTACPGPEGGECPRFYLYTGHTIRVANTDLLEADWKDRQGATPEALRARALAEAAEPVPDPFVD
jgi:hypothetical protein